MRDFTLQNVGEPTNAGDIATKEYVDNSGGGAFEVRNGGYNAKGHLYIGDQKIGGVRDPINDGEAANKRYVDNYVEKYVNDYVEELKDENGVFVSPWGVNIVGNKLSCLSIPSKSDEAATKEYTDKVGNDVREYVDQSSELLGRRFHNLPFAFLKDNGNFVAHTPISMASQPLNDLPEPQKTSDAVTKKYVDDLIADNVGVGNMNGGDSPFFKENGNYLAAHAINMAFKKLLNLSTTSEPFEAATKDYVDKVVNDDGKYVDHKNANIKKEVDELIKLLDNVSTVNKIYVDQKPNIIAVIARFSGVLEQGKYQLAFAGSAADHDDDRSGFVVPHRGFIKKIMLDKHLLI